MRGQALETGFGLGTGLQRGYSRQRDHFDTDLICAIFSEPGFSASLVAFGCGCPDFSSVCILEFGQLTKDSDNHIDKLIADTGPSIFHT